VPAAVRPRLRSGLRKDSLGKRIALKLTSIVLGRLFDYSCLPRQGAPAHKTLTPVTRRRQQSVLQPQYGSGTTPLVTLTTQIEREIKRVLGILTPRVQHATRTGTSEPHRSSIRIRGARLVEVRNTPHPPFAASSARTGTAKNMTAINKDKRIDAECMMSIKYYLTKSHRTRRCIRSTNSFACCA
jgi:hypothetical protein